MLENVQRRAVKFILNFFRMIYPKDMSYKQGSVGQEKTAQTEKLYHLDGTVLTTASETINLGITTTDNFSGLQTYIRSSCKQTVLLALFAKSAETSVTLTLGNFYTVQLFAPN